MATQSKGVNLQQMRLSTKMEEEDIDSDRPCTEEDITNPLSEDKNGKGGKIDPFIDEDFRMNYREEIQAEAESPVET